MLNIRELEKIAETNERGVYLSIGEGTQKFYEYLKKDDKEGIKRTAYYYIMDINMDIKSNERKQQMRNTLEMFLNTL